MGAHLGRRDGRHILVGELLEDGGLAGVVKAKHKHAQLLLLGGRPELLQQCEQTLVVRVGVGVSMFECALLSGT